LDAEDVGAVIGDPGALADIAEVFHARQVIERGQVALVEKRREASTGGSDQVAGGPAFQLGVPARRCTQPGRWGKFNLDVGVLGFKGRNDGICQILISSLRQLSMVRVTVSSAGAGGSVAAGAGGSVAAGAGGSVAAGAGGSVAAGAGGSVAAALGPG